MKHILAICAVLALGAFAAADDRKEVKNGANKVPMKLDGTYTLVSGEKDGKPIPKEEIEGSVLKFQGNKIIGHDKDNKEFFSCTFVVDEASSPHRIAMSSKAPKEGMKAKGIIEANGDTVRICYALPGGAEPTDFKAGEKQHCFVMRRVPNGKEK